MNTVDFLQLWLSAQTVRYSSVGGENYGYKDPAPCLVLKNGEVLSIQAGETLYSYPKEAFGPYESVEVLFIHNRDSSLSWKEFVFGGDYFDHIHEHEHEPFSWVNMDRLSAFIDCCGGIAIAQTIERIKAKSQEDI